MDKVILSDFSKTSIKYLTEMKQYKEYPGKMVVPIGSNDNEHYYYDFANLNTLLIAGTTGSGKTSFLRSLIAFLILNYSEKDVQFIIQSSKIIDYTVFNGIPHLLIPVCTNPSKCCGTISWAYSEAERRLRLLESGSRENFSDWFIIIDDFQEVSDNTQYTEYLEKLLKICRNVKIHCFVSTSIPTAKIISTNLKANMPFRMAFRTASKLDSRIIIDENGAEKLSMPGEIIFKEHSRNICCHAIYVPDEDIASIVNYRRTRTQTTDFQSQELTNDFSNSEGYNADDQLFEEAKEYIISIGVASTSLLQRKFSLGYSRSAKIMDQLEAAKIIGPSNGAKPREVLIKK